MRCERLLEKAHAYEVPEVMAMPVWKALRNYMHWLEGELAG